MGNALDILTTIMNSYGLEASEVTNVSDILIQTQNLDKTTVAAIEAMLPSFHCTLMTMPGIDVATAANLLPEIGNIDRFPNSDKLAKFAGIAP